MSDARVPDGNLPRKRPRDTNTRERELCRRLLVPLKEGAESDDDRVARLALELTVQMLVDHSEGATA
jgi:hypothetical protein